MNVSCAGSYIDGREGTIIDRSLMLRVEDEVKAYGKLGFLSSPATDLVTDWRDRLATQPQRFIINTGDDWSIDHEALRNFRRHQILVNDVPSHDSGKFDLKSLLGGGRRGQRRMLREILAVLKDHGDVNLLRKYPCHPAGNPQIFHYQGFSYTHRWFKHIYLLSLLNRVLGPKLEKSFVGLDVGSSYGIFSSLVKKEYPDSHHILVDFPEQLILAYYFLGACFPEAKIAGIEEVSSLDTISRDFVERFDFVLVPHTLYQKIGPGAGDLVTNFASFGEMRRYWFDYYLKSEPFVTAKYFFTANHIQSYPTYDTDVTILDYPIWDPEKKLHFGNSPGFTGYFTYHRRALFFYEKRAYAPFFEYIGKI